MVVEPGFFVADHRQALHQSRQLAFVEDVFTRRSRVSLQVPDRRDCAHENTTRRESLDHLREEALLQVMEAENQVPRSNRKGIALQVGVDQIQGESASSGGVGGNRQCRVGNIDNGHTQPAIGQPKGVATIPPCNVEGATRSRKKICNRLQKR